MNNISASFTGIAAGAVVGYFAERITAAVDLTGVANIFSTNTDTVTRVDNALLMLLEAGLIGVALSIAQDSLPVLTQNLPSMGLCTLALVSTTPNIRTRIAAVANQFIYSTPPASAATAAAAATTATP
jgi:hypothetical protein